MTRSLEINIEGFGILWVTGRLTEAEPEVGLPLSFEVKAIDADLKADFSMDLFELIEWCDAQKGDALAKITELCEQHLKYKK